MLLNIPDAGDDCPVSILKLDTNRAKLAGAAIFELINLPGERIILATAKAEFTILLIKELTLLAGELIFDEKDLVLCRMTLAGAAKLEVMVFGFTTPPEVYILENDANTVMTLDRIWFFILNKEVVTNTDLVSILVDPRIIDKTLEALLEMAARCLILYINDLVGELVAFINERTTPTPV